MASLGIRARAIAAAIEEVPQAEWQGASPAVALDGAARMFVARTEHEIRDLEAAIASERPDMLLIDFNCWGAAAFAESSGLPWALFLPYFLPWRLPGLPPFGPGLSPRSDVIGKVRDAAIGLVAHRLVNRNLAKLNGVRARVDLPPLSHMTDVGRSAPCILYYTAEPFEYACAARPASVVMIGPGLWEPRAEAPPWLEAIDRPIVLVTCSTEAGDDGRLVEVALEALSEEDVFVVATTGAADPSRFRPPRNARVERFVPHGVLLPRASAVICHGAMGITQKALAAGVPVCAVPFGRDQPEVARHLEVARAGVRLSPKKLTPARLRASVTKARACRPGAERVASAFRAAGGPGVAADVLESLCR